jgi:hypothetical protein
VTFAFLAYNTRDAAVFNSTLDAINAGEGSSPSIDSEAHERACCAKVATAWLRAVTAIVATHHLHRRHHIVAMFEPPSADPTIVPNTTLLRRVHVLDAETLASGEGRIACALLRARWSAASVAAHGYMDFEVHRAFAGFGSSTNAIADYSEAAIHRGAIFFNLAGGPQSGERDPKRQPTFPRCSSALSVRR